MVVSVDEDETTKGAAVEVTGVVVAVDVAGVGAVVAVLAVGAGDGAAVGKGVGSGVGAGVASGDGASVGPQTVLMLACCLRAGISVSKQRSELAVGPFSISRETPPAPEWKPKKRASATPRAAIGPAKQSTTLVRQYRASVSSRRTWKSLLPTQPSHIPLFVRSVAKYSDGILVEQLHATAKICSPTNDAATPAWQLSTEAQKHAWPSTRETQSAEALVRTIKNSNILPLEERKTNQRPTQLFSQHRLIRVCFFDPTPSVLKF